MKKAALMIVALTSLLCVSSRAFAQNASALGEKIEQAIQQKEPEWKLIRKLQAIVSAHDNVFGRLGRKERTVSLMVYYLESQAAAAEELKRSQDVLQINISHPIKGFGDQAYEAHYQGKVWMTFRKSNVFVIVSIDPREPKKLEQMPDIENLSREALEVAKRFAQLVADQIPAT